MEFSVVAFLDLLLHLLCIILVQRRFRNISRVFLDESVARNHQLIRIILADEGDFRICVEALFIRAGVECHVCTIFSENPEKVSDYDVLVLVFYADYQ